MQSVIPAGRQKSEVELIFLKARVGLSLQGKESERFQQEIRTPEQAFSTQQKKMQQEEGRTAIEDGTQKTARDAPRLPERQVKRRLCDLQARQGKRKDTGASSDPRY
jgi:hypothetical protein